MGVYFLAEPILSDSEWATLLTIKYNNYRIKFLLDCGLSDSFNQKSIKKLLSYTSDINYILLTHSTLSYVGGLPIFIRNYHELSGKPQLICTEPLFKFAKANLLDTVENLSLNMQNTSEFYTADDVENAFTNLKILRYNEHLDLSTEFLDLFIMPFNCGYSVGGAAYILTMGTKQTLICRKISLLSEWHLNPFTINSINNPYLFVTDLPKLSVNTSLYHASLDSIINLSIKTLNKGNSVFIPTDIDSRLIELLHHFRTCWSNQYVAKWPIIFLSPNASKLSLIFTTCIEYMSNNIKTTFFKSLKNPLHFDNVTFLNSIDQLKPFANVPCVIFSTPGSLNWGCSNALFASMSSKKGNLIILLKEPSKKSVARKLSLYISRKNSSMYFKVKIAPEKKPAVKRPKKKAKTKQVKEVLKKSNKFSWQFKFKKPISNAECYELYKNNKVEIDSLIEKGETEEVRKDDSNIDVDVNEVPNELLDTHLNGIKQKPYSIISSDPLAHINFTTYENSKFPTFSERDLNSSIVSNIAKNSDEDDYGLVVKFSDLWNARGNETTETIDPNSTEHPEVKNEDVEDLMDLGQKVVNNAHGPDSSNLDTAMSYYFKLNNMSNNFNNEFSDVSIGNCCNTDLDWMNGLVKWFGGVPSRYIKKTIKQSIRAKVFLAFGLDNTIDQYSLDTLTSILRVKKVCLLPTSTDTAVTFKYKIPSPIESLVNFPEYSFNGLDISSNGYFFDKLLDKCSKEARDYFNVVDLKIRICKVSDGNPPRLTFWQNKEPSVYAIEHVVEDEVNVEEPHGYPAIPIFKIANTFNELLPGMVHVVGSHSAIVISSKTIVQKVESVDDNEEGVSTKWLIRGVVDPSYYLARKALYALHGNLY